jgi:hypothetical protein
MAERTSKESMDKTDAPAMAVAKSVDAAPPAAPAPAGSGVTDTDDTPDIQVSYLVSHASAFLGYPSHVAAGALHDVDPDSEMSIGQAQCLVEEWLAKEIISEGTEG